MIVDEGDFQAAGCGAGAGVDGADVKGLVEGDVGAEDLENDALGLEGVDLARGADELGEMDGVGADVGADFNRDLPRREQLGENLGFELAIFAVEVERRADEFVSAQEHYFAVPAFLDFGERRGGLVRHLTPENDMFIWFCNL